MVLLAGLWLAVWLAPLSAAQTGPRAVVDAFHAGLLDVMRRAENLDFDARYAALKPSVESAFHFPLMVRVISGTSWRDASPAQQSSLTETFTHMSVTNYAARFDGYSGQSFETVGQRDGPQSTVLVETHLVRPDDDPVTLTYVTKKFGEEWRIVDVLLTGGISELALRHSEYRKILRDRGVEGLIRSLKDKAAEMAAAN